MVIRLPGRFINTKYLIEAETWDAGPTKLAPGGVRLWLLSGREVVLGPDDATRFWRQIDDHFGPEPGSDHVEPTGKPTTASVTPHLGDLLPTHTRTPKPPPAQVDDPQQGGA